VALTPDQLLSELIHGTLSLDAVCTQLAELIRAGGNSSRLRALVQGEIVAGGLSHAAGRALLAAMDKADALTAGYGDTAMHGKIDEEDSLTARIASGDATLRQDSDVTELKAARKIEPTLVRPASAAKSTQSSLAADVELTQRQSSASSIVREDESLTVAKSASDTVAHDPDATRGSRTPDPDETIHGRPRAPRTAARTLHMDGGVVAGQSAYAATLKAQQPAADKTQVLGERLVRSLDEVEPGHRGPLQPGSIIKQRFVLDTLIGKGGMGLVFSAIDRRKEEAEDPNPRVAFKVLNADFQRHPQSFMALQREARKAQTLAHPNVVTVFDFDRDGDAVYMTMELLTGRPLEAIVREARGKGVDRNSALPIIRGIAEGLAYAHRKGIVHSDLKPGNVFIGNDNTPKILDFGIARAVPSLNAEASQDVFDAGSLGAYTEAYATDEMVDGVDPHPADDMYALGIIGYELLTGFHPYQRHSAPNARKMGIKPPPLKGLKLREQRALEKCLSLDRRQRPRDAAEFLKMFRGVTTLQKATLAATAVLAIASGYLWYQNYLETSPVIPFSQLPVATQQEFTQKMQEGDQELAFFQRENNPAMLQDAITSYTAAYALHRRNRDAVKALNRVAGAFLKLAGDDAAARKQAAQALQEYSDYYLKYQPVVDAAR
jgi:serine/threonine protein kinase